MIDATLHTVTLWAYLCSARRCPLLILDFGFWILDFGLKKSCPARGQLSRREAGEILNGMGNKPL
jgi:hypothetical protein